MTEPLQLLLIEDSDDDAELVTVELARSGYDFRITRAETWPQVCAALEERRYALILSDYRIPGFSGADVLERVRAHDGEVPFIVVSGTIGEEIAVDLIRAGANDYVMKGKLARLGVAVRRELERVTLAQERARLERDLERTRDRLARTVDLAPVGVCHNALDGRWTMVNRAFCDILGYSPEELRGMTFMDLTHPDDLSQNFRARQAMENGTLGIYETEKRYICKDGSLAWVSLSATLVRTEEGAPDYFVSVISDITDKRSARQALYDSELRYRTLVETAHEGIWLIDATGSTSFANSTLLEMLDMPADEVRRTPVGAISPEVAALVDQLCAREAGATATEEILFERPDGTWIWSAVSARSVEATATSGPAVLVVLMDITKRVRMETILIERDLELQEAQRLASLASWEYNLDRGELRCSDEISRILGLDRATIERDPSVALALFEPTDRATASDAIRRGVEKNEPVDFDLRFRRPDGSNGMLYARARLLPNGDQAPTTIVGIVQDITERRRTQDALRRRAQQQESIALLGHMALAGCTPEMLLDELTSRLLTVMDADFSDLFKVLPSGDIRLEAAKGWADAHGLIGELTIPAGPETHVGYTIATGMTIAIDSLPEEERFTMPPPFAGQGVMSGLLVPVAGGSEGAFATIGVYSREPRHFAAEDENFLSACAHVLAETVQRQKNEDALRGHARQQSALAELANRLLREPAENAIRICDVVTATLDVEYAAFLEIDDGGRTAVVADGAMWLGGPGARIPLAGTQTEYTIAEGGPLVIDDFETEWRFNGRPYFELHGIRSGVSVPVRGSGGAVFGVIKAASRTHRQFARDHVQFLQALADLLAEGLERRATQRELNASRERYRNVVEGAAEIMVSMTARGRILTLNKAFEEITGWPAEQWLGRHCLDLVMDEDREAARAVLLSGETRLSPSAGSIRIRTADGSIRDIELSSVALQDEDGGTEIFGFGRDVTERRRSEAARNRLADELALILDSVAEGIYGFDVTGRCTMMNRAAASMLGCDREALIGSMVEGIHRTEAEPGAPSLLQLIASGASMHVAEGTFAAVDGRVLPVEFSASPLIENDVVVGGVVCFWDISRRQHLETQLEQERRLSSLGKLAANVAHEFNNVMMGIAPFAELIARRVGSSNGPISSASEHIRAAVRRGKRVTEEVLRFANPVPSSVAPVAVPRWLRLIEAELRTMLTSVHELQVEAEPLTMVADATQLSQVIVNLGLNARDAMVEGGKLVLSARAAAPELAMRFALPRNAEDYVHFSISDTGSGIAKEHLDHIFEPLFTTKRSGTGLGLAITHQIVKRHKGEIFVETELGSGTTFHVFIPRTVTAAKNETVEPAPKVRRRLEQTRVLLVEDDEHVAAGLQLALEAEGITVRRVATGEEALTALAGSDIDAAIVDIGLPDMDGTRVYEAGAKKPRIPIVFSTGHADESKVAPYLTDDRVAYLLKPYAIDVLLDTLAGVLPR
ncbi:MAG TPA: PAS domain S-box protein [Thermoanaerobaculia bacterium]|jgi:PAS domain S-box-containing protein